MKNSCDQNVLYLYFINANTQVVILQYSFVRCYPWVTSKGYTQKNSVLFTTTAYESTIISKGLIKEKQEYLIYLINQGVCGNEIAWQNTWM